MRMSLRPVAKGPNLNYTRLAFLGPLDRVGSAFGDRLQPQAAESSRKVKWETELLRAVAPRGHPSPGPASCQL